MKSIAIAALLATSQAVTISSMKDAKAADCPCANHSCMLKTEDDAKVQAAKDLIELGKAQLHKAQVQASKDGAACTKASQDVVKKAEKKVKAKVEKAKNEVKVVKKEEHEVKQKVEKA